MQTVSLKQLCQSLGRAKADVLEAAKVLGFDAASGVTEEQKNRLSEVKKVMVSRGSSSLSEAAKLYVTNSNSQRANNIGANETIQNANAGNHLATNSFKEDIAIVAHKEGRYGAAAYHVQRMASFKAQKVEILDDPEFGPPLRQMYSQLHAELDNEYFAEMGGQSVFNPFLISGEPEPLAITGSTDYTEE